MRQKTVVLLSGGQDSTTCLHWAIDQKLEPYTVSFDYGQRHVRELEAAKQIAKNAGVPHTVLSLSVLKEIGDSALIDTTRELKGDGGLPDREMPKGLPTSFVPGRNILLLTAAAAYAVKIGAESVVGGMCQTDYSGYPDCRRETIDALERTLKLGLGKPIRLLTPLMFLTKAETVRMARELPSCWTALGFAITCYLGERPGCGKCPACELRQKGFEEAGCKDPARESAKV